jgi:peptide-methionine (R)-S-oxide reductase
MNNKIKLLSMLSLQLIFLSCKSKQDIGANVQAKTTAVNDSLPYFINANGDKIDRVIKTNEEWKKELSSFDYYVLAEKGTERPFTSDLLKIKTEGSYTCKACGYVLFRSKDKFDSGTGWPSFSQPAEEQAMHSAKDHDIGYERTEVMCARCRLHLGHVFDDGPKPTGLRYCINGASLNFVESQSGK